MMLTTMIGEALKVFADLTSYLFSCVANIAHPFEAQTTQTNHAADSITLELSRRQAFVQASQNRVREHVSARKQTPKQRRNAARLLHARATAGSRYHSMKAGADDDCSYPSACFRSDSNGSGTGRAP